MEFAAPPVKEFVNRYTIDQFMLTVRMSGISFSHDETEILVTSNRSGVFNAYLVPMTGGSPRQLTFSTEESINSISHFPHDGRILYIRDKGGSENRHLCVGEEDGTEIQLTHGDTVRAGCHGWSADGSHFYCTSNERTHLYLDVYRVNARTYEKELIFRNDDGFNPAGLSREGEYLFLVKYENFSDSNLYLYHLESNTTQLITPHTANVFYLPLFIDQEGQYFHYHALETEAEAIHYRYNLNTGTREECGRRPRTFRRIIPSDSGRLQAVITDEKERSTLVLEDCETGAQIPLKTFPEGNINNASISKSDRWLAFYVNGDRDPSELYLYDLQSQQLSRLTNNLNPEIRREELVESEVLSFASFDGLEIPCLLWKPHRASAQRKVPALIWVHGGPLGQVRKGYAGAVQFLVNHDYAVFAVNHRGSVGYGRAFMNAADGKQGREPLWDCVAAKHYLATLDFVDSERIGIMGGSFGGYMTLAALAFHPDEFEVGVAICGVSNLVRHMEEKLQDPHAARIYLQKIGHPVKDRAMLEAASPALHAARIVKPLLVINGAKDPRARRIESEDIVNAVRANGGIVEHLEFDDEAHGFRKRVNSVTAYQTVLTFLERYLRAEDDLRQRASVA
jgi:dipeptidyl aminopeptidase/acylaminoacyl peptidase